jgi:hypothetical protein
MADGEVLAQLRGYACWTPELDALAVEAAADGVLEGASNRAHARYFDLSKSSSVSSVTFAMGTVRGDAVFADLLRDELRRALGLLD